MLLVVECGLRIAGLPKKERPKDPELDEDLEDLEDTEEAEDADEPAR